MYGASAGYTKPSTSCLRSSLTPPTSDATDGTPTTTAQDYLTYIKTVRTHGASKVNLQQVVTQVDGLAKVGRDFAETRAQDEHNAILSVLKGVALTEVLYGAAAGSGAFAAALPRAFARARLAEKSASVRLRLGAVSLPSAIFDSCLVDCG